MISFEVLNQTQSQINDLQVKSAREDTFVYRSLLRHDRRDFLVVTGEKSVDLMASFRLQW